MYSVTFTKQALKTLRRMPRTVANLIREKIGVIALDPHVPNNNVTKLVGRSGYRLRVGDWRVIYELQDEQLVMQVIKVGSRGEIYE